MATVNPLPSFKFRVELNGKVTGYFTEVSGIGSETETIEHKVVSENGVDMIMKVPGRLKWTEITLKRGITDDMQMWEWRKTVEQGEMEKARSNFSIIMMDRAGAEKARWDFVNAWPSKISGPSIKSDSNEFGIEEFVIQHEGIDRVKA